MLLTPLPLRPIDTTLDLSWGMIPPHIRRWSRVISTNSTGGQYLCSSSTFKVTTTTTPALSSLLGHYPPVTTEGQHLPFPIIDILMSPHIARALHDLEWACIVYLDSRISMQATRLMLHQFLSTFEDILVANLIYEHNVYLVTFPIVEIALEAVGGRPVYFEGFRFFCKY